MEHHPLVSCRERNDFTCSRINRVHLLQCEYRLSLSQLDPCTNPVVEAQRYILRFIDIFSLPNSFYLQTQQSIQILSSTAVTIISKGF
jgi:hypothetical protein